MLTAGVGAGVGGSHLFAVFSALYTPTHPWYYTLVQHRPPRVQTAIPHTPTSTHTKWGINPPLRTTALPTPQLSAGRVRFLWSCQRITRDILCARCRLSAGGETSGLLVGPNPFLLNRRVRLQLGRKNNLSFAS